MFRLSIVPDSRGRFDSVRYSRCPPTTVRFVNDVIRLSTVDVRPPHHWFCLHFASAEFPNNPFRIVRFQLTLSDFDFPCSSRPTVLFWVLAVYTFRRPRSSWDCKPTVTTVMLCGGRNEIWLDKNGEKNMRAIHLPIADWITVRNVWIFNVQSQLMSVRNFKINCWVSIVRCLHSLSCKFLSGYRKQEKCKNSVYTYR